MALFKEDLDFLKKYQHVVVLKDPHEKAQVVICPDFQSKVMTSTCEGMNGRSLGFINYELIASGKIRPDINPVGGEDRFWIGPEGGQYAVFFKKGEEFVLENAITPSGIDREPFEVLTVEQDKAIFRKRMQLQNYMGTVFKVTVVREISLIPAAMASSYLGIKISEETNYVGFESGNMMINTGSERWSEESGLLSIWILGMFPPSDKVTCFFPYTQGLDDRLGRIVNDDYFGEIPSDRLCINDGMIFFKGDGKFRSKIGIAFPRAHPVIGSYDSENNVLTIVHLTMPQEQMEYVNSMWEFQSTPYAGDVVNSYNHGDSEPGFYELESSSPAAALSPGEGITHIHRTFHFTGEESGLSRICESIFRISLNDVKRVFNA